MLENKLSEVETEKKSSKLKSYLVDTLGLWIFFQPIKTFSELYVGGLDTEEFLKSRLFGLITAITITYPATKLIDKYAEKVWKVNKNSSFWRKTASDLSFAVPLTAAIYSGVLALSGAEPDEIIRTVPTNCFLTIPAVVMVGRKYLSYIRKKFGTTPDYLLKDNL